MIQPKLCTFTAFCAMLIILDECLSNLELFYLTDKLKVFCFPPIFYSYSLHWFSNYFDDAVKTRLL